MKGYIGIFTEKDESGNVIYLEDYYEDYDWDFLHMVQTKDIEKAKFLTRECKSWLESSMVEHNRENDVYFVEVERTTVIIGGL